MEEWLQILLNMLAQFTGGRGGIDHVIVNYVIAALFWAVLWLLALARSRQTAAPRERLLLWGFAIALSRELFMIVMALLQALQIMDPVSLHTVFPPLEHELHDLSLVVIGAAYLRYLLDNAPLARRFLIAGLSVCILCYLSTFWWWASYITANPDSTFGKVWPDWLFHINRSIWAAVPMVILARNAKGWARNAIVTAFFLFFLHAILKLPDMAMDEVYEHIFTPIARSFYLIGIPIIGYVYIREQWQERQHAEQKLQQSHEVLEELVERRTRELEKSLAKEKGIAADLKIFSTSVAHDLKAPLHSMETCAGLIVRDFSEGIDPAGGELLVELQNRAQQMGALIDGLLEYSKLGRDEMVFEQVDMETVLSRVLQNLSGEIEQTNADISVPETSSVIEGNTVCLVQLFQNLVSNAIHYVAEGIRPEIRISLKQQGDAFAFTIKDNGIGIAPAYHEHIFNIFNRVHTRKTYTGTGVGLAIVKRVIEMHHGSITLKSEPDHGSTFTIILPARQCGAG